MRQDVKDQIAGLRAQIKAHREHAKRMRQNLRELKSAPIGRRDPIGAIRMQDAINNRMNAISACKSRISELQAEAGIKRNAA